METRLALLGRLPYWPRPIQPSSFGILPGLCVPPVYRRDVNTGRAMGGLATVRKILYAFVQVIAATGLGIGLAVLGRLCWQSRDSCTLRV